MKAAFVLAALCQFQTEPASMPNVYVYHSPGCKACALVLNEQANGEWNPKTCKFHLIPRDPPDWVKYPKYTTPCFHWKDAKGQWKTYCPNVWTAESKTTTQELLRDSLYRQPVGVGSEPRFSMLGESGEFLFRPDSKVLFKLDNNTRIDYSIIKGRYTVKDDEVNVLFESPEPVVTLQRFGLPFTIPLKSVKTLPGALGVEITGQYWGQRKHRIVFQ